MNSSIYRADRATHLRIAAVVLLISIAIVGFGMTARIKAVGAIKVSEDPGQIQKPGPFNRESAALQTAPGGT